VLALAGCLRPSQARVERDGQVGQAQGARLTVRVEGGQAAVRAMADDSLTLWAGAPVLDLHLSAKSDGPVTLVVRNTFSDAACTATDSRGAAQPVRARAGEVPTERQFDLDLRAGEELSLHLAPPDAEDHTPFRFGALSDIQEALPKVQDIYARVNRDPQLRFLIAAGDLTSNGSVEQLEQFQHEMRTLRVPYFATLGNHDIGTSSLPWYDYFGRASQHFRFHQAAFSLVDSASATLDPGLYDALDGWLAGDAKANLFRVVAMHIPPLDPVGTRDGAFASRDEAAKLLSRLANAGVGLTLYGHIHSFYAFSNAGIPAFISGGGGAIPERMDGMGRHYLQVDLDPATGDAQVSPVRIDVPP
jgi:predicted phosphodiesterase